MDTNAIIPCTNKCDHVSMQLMAETVILITKAVCATAKELLERNVV